MMVKLSEKQVKLLRCISLRDGNCTSWSNVDYWDTNTWRIMPSRTLRSLKCRGFIFESSYYTLHVTKSGKEYLNSLDKQNEVEISE